jgi:hypothetical protein
LYSNSLTSWWERFFATKLLERKNYDEADAKVGLRKGLSASSLQGYSYALTEFHKFLEQNEKTLDMARNSYSNFLRLKGAQEKWRKSLLKTKQKEYNKRETEEADNVLTIEELPNALHSSSPKTNSDLLRFAQTSRLFSETTL